MSELIIVGFVGKVNFLKLMNIMHFYVDCLISVPNKVVLNKYTVCNA